MYNLSFLGFGMVSRLFITTTILIITICSSSSNSSKFNFVSINKHFLSQTVKFYLFTILSPSHQEAVGEGLFGP